VLYRFVRRLHGDVCVFVSLFILHLLVVNILYCFSKTGLVFYSLFTSIIIFIFSSIFNCDEFTREWVGAICGVLTIFNLILMCVIFFIFMICLTVPLELDALGAVSYICITLESLFFFTIVYLDFVYGRGSCGG